MKLCIQAIFNPTDCFICVTHLIVVMVLVVIAITLFPGASALLLLLLILGVFVVLGMIADGLRMAMLFVGTLLSLLIAPLLGSFVPRSFLPDNPLWRELGIGGFYAFAFLMIILLEDLLCHLVPQKAFMRL